MYPAAPKLIKKRRLHHSDSQKVIQVPKTQEIVDVDGYVRVSLEEQAAHGFSLEAQEKKITLYCELHDLNLRHIYSDPGASGKDLNRPGMQAVLQDLRQARTPSTAWSSPSWTGSPARCGTVPRSSMSSSVSAGQATLQRRRIHRHPQGGRPAGPERDHDRRPVGARGHRRTDQGCPADEDCQGGKSRQNQVRL